MPSLLGCLSTLFFVFSFSIFFFKIGEKLNFPKILAGTENTPLLNKEHKVKQHSNHISTPFPAFIVPALPSRPRDFPHTMAFF